MITDEKIKVNVKPLDQETINKILSIKEKYSPEELKSIISLMENPYSKIIFQKLLDR